MTTAPQNLLDLRALLMTYLPGLSAVELGIVGDSAHRGGYHQGKGMVSSTDYSVDESPRDGKNLSEFASALDVGFFELRRNGVLHSLRTFSVWCVNECRRGAPDTRDIREIIYSDNGRRVLRWDRLGIRDSGDSSHLSHTHFSFFRDSRSRDQRPLFRRYLQSIGVLPAPVESAGRPLILAIMGGDGEMPYLLMKFTKRNEVFACYPSGAVRHIGPKEMEHLQAQGVLYKETADQGEFDRLLAASSLFKS